MNSNLFEEKVESILSTYLSFSEKLEIRVYLDKYYVLFVENRRRDVEDSKILMEDKYKINKVAKEIIELVDGTRTYGGIISLLCKRYNEDFESILNKVDRFLNQVQYNYKIRLNFTESPSLHEITIKQEKSFYPTVASIELTYRCNLKCLHCYGEYGNKDYSTMSFSNVKKLLHDLKAMGTRVIELTGGEITMHPQLNDIIEEAVKLDFKQISLLTNGVALSKEVCDTIIKNRKKIIIQIDIHSLDDSYLHWFTKVPNTLERIKKSIIYLNENKVTMRIATVMTPKNVNELESIADWVHQAGIASYAISPVINVGRALDYNNSNEEEQLHFSDLASYMKFQKCIIDINEKYPNFVNIVEDAHYSEMGKVNCGSLTSNVNITPSGDIKLCAMDNLSYMNSGLGNVFEKNIKDIYDQNEVLFDILYRTEPPKSNSAECSDCEHRFFCGNCLLRGVIKSKDLGEACKWYTEKVPDLLKNTLFSYPV